MPRESSFCFVPVSSSYKKVVKKATVTINKKKQIFFSNAYMRDFAATDKFIKFYIDSGKRTLGWKLTDTIDSLKGLKRRENRRLKRLACGIAVLQIRGILTELKIPDRDYKKLPVETYYDRIHGTLHYVKIPYSEINLKKIKVEKDSEESPEELS